MRDMLFISHANSEDNEFALWLSLQLASAGYPVWCDLTKLLGGEDFWNDIQTAIRTRTVKFLFLLSRASNSKPGTLAELELATKVRRADNLKDFILPLWLDDLTPTEFDIRLGSLAAIRFQESWAKGLSKVLEKLSEDSVAKKATFNSAAVATWWKSFSEGTKVQTTPEELDTNWYPLLPTTLYFHELSRVGPGSIELPSFLPYPAIRHNQYLVTFAKADAFRPLLLPTLTIESTITREVGGLGPEQHPRMWTPREESAALASLMRQAWLCLLNARNLSKYEFANGAMSFYFKKDQLESDRAWFSTIDGARSWRAVSGEKTRKVDGVPTVVRYWHFGLEGKPTTSPFVGYTMKSHVLFSDDGSNIWPSKDKLHRTRRSHCNNWWNDRWRDLLLAGTAFLAEGNQVIRLPVGPEEVMCVSSMPIRLTSPVGYHESQEETPEATQSTESRDDDLGDDDLGDDLDSYSDISTSSPIDDN